MNILGLARDHLITKTQMPAADFQVAKQKIRVRQIVSHAWNDIMNNHTMALAAGLSYYFVLSLFPLMILLASIVGYLPIPNLFEMAMSTLAYVMPQESLAFVRKILISIITPGRAGLLTFGIIGTIWTASSGFASMIEALNVAYDVPETRRWWRTRLLAVAMAFVLGALWVVALVLIVAGPRVVEFLAGKVGLAPTFLAVWPYLRWGISITAVVLAVELLFYWGPNVKQRFWATLPGAVIGVGFWIGSSYLLSLYFSHFANFNKTYGTLGAGIALMTWLYWSSFAILCGAEINSELLKAATEGKLEIKEKPPAAVKPRHAWEEHPAA